MEHTLQEACPCLHATTSIGQVVVLRHSPLPQSLRNVVEVNDSWGGQGRHIQRTNLELPSQMGIREKGTQEVLATSVMSQYVGAKTRVGVDSDLSEEFEAKVRMHKGSVLTPF